jgi:hypothetical protein
MSKWYFIAMGLFFCILAGSAAVGEYQKNECKMELAKAGKTAEEIRQICN